MKNMIAQIFSSLLLASLLLTGATANAAIPSSKTIVSRMAKNNGRGVYVIEQEIQFLNAAEGSNLIKERWIIQNAEVMRLIATGSGIRWDALYRDGRRLASVNDAASAETKAFNISHEFLEPFLYIRSSAKFFDYFIKNKILPPSAAKPTARIANIGTYKPVSEAAVRLGREGGAIAWVFGEPTPVGSAIQYPGAWIEQDAFLLRKIRLPQQTEMTMSAHAPAGSGFKLPRERTITWRPSDKSIDAVWSATVKVLSAKSFAEGSLAPQLQGGSITPAEAKMAHLPNDPVVKDFYARFR